MEPECKRKKGAEHDDLDSWDVLPVLSDEQSQDVKLLDAYAAPIVEKRETSRLIRDLSGIYPLPNLQHLKRVRARRDEGIAQRLEVIVCLLSDVHDLPTLPEPPSIKDLLVGRDFNSAGLGDPFVVRVPAGPPLTRPQFERASEHWPTSFHEDKQITCALTGRLFSSNQKARMREYMTTAVQAAELARGRGMDAVGAVMVDPRTDQILAVGHDLRRGTHPLQHAVMVCIDLVACRQGGGAYGYVEYPGCTYSVPASDGEGTPQEYICTGYDLYVTREPCAMCAMALLHSRIGRVFYGVASPDGALGTKFKIHCQKDLNHHFDVYKGVMLRSCEGLRGPK